MHLECCQTTQLLAELRLSKVLPFLGASDGVGFEHHLEAGRLKEFHPAARVDRLSDPLVAQPQPPAVRVTVRARARRGVETVGFE